MSPLQKLTVAIDVDEVCAQLYDEWLRRYNRDYEDNLRFEDITSWEISSFVKPKAKKAVFDYLREPDLYKKVQPYPGAKKAVEFLRFFGHRVLFVTSCVRGGFDSKAEWLVEQGFLPDDQRSLKDFVPCSDKSLIRADVLVDDGVHNLETFPKWKVLVSRPHNLKADPKFPHWRVSDLMQAAQRIDSVLGRMIRTA